MRSRSRTQSAIAVVISSVSAIMTSLYRLARAIPIVGFSIRSRGTMNVVPVAWTWLMADRCCLPIRTSSYGWLRRSCPLCLSSETRRPGISATAESSLVSKGTGNSATASRRPTPGTYICRTTSNTHSPVAGLRIGPATTAAPLPATAFRPGRSMGRLRFHEFARADAQIVPSGRRTMMSRKAKVWKFNPRSRRPADFGSTSNPSLATASNSAGRLASAPSTWRN